MKFTIFEFKRGIIQKTIWSRVTVLLLCKLSDDAMKFLENILKGCQVMKHIRIDHCQISKENNYKTIYM